MKSFVVAVTASYKSRVGGGGGGVGVLELALEVYNNNIPLDISGVIANSV